MNTQVKIVFQLTFLIICMSSYVNAKNILSTSQFTDNDKTYTATLSETIDISSVHENGEYFLVNQIKRPISNISQIFISNRYLLHTGKNRHYVLILSDQKILSVWSIDNIVNDQRLIQICQFNDMRVASLSMLNANSEDETLVSEENRVFLSFDDGSKEESTLRDILTKAFETRDKNIISTKNAGEAEVDQYINSWQFAGAKNYAKVDGFFRGLIPFDDDFIPMYFNKSVFGTNARAMVIEDLNSKGLLDFVTPEQSKQMATEIGNSQYYSMVAGGTALVSIPVATKGRRMYQGYRAAQVEKLSRLAKLKAALPAKFAAQSPHVAAVEKYANGSVGLHFVSKARDFFTHGFNRGTIQRYKEEVFLWTNLTLGSGMVLSQTANNGPNPKNWNWGTMAFEAGFINTLTFIVMGVVAYECNYGLKILAIVGAIDVIDPIGQYIEHGVIGDKDVEFMRDVFDPVNFDLKPIDPAQSMFDKLFVGFFALPKSDLVAYRLNPWLQNKYAGAKFAPLIGPSVVTANEIAGNTFYSIHKGSPYGPTLLNDYMSPAIAFDQMDFEGLLKEGQMIFIPLEQMPEELLVTENK